MSFNSYTPNTVIRSSKINEDNQASVHLTDLQKISNKIPVPSVVSSNSGAFDLDAGSVFTRTLDGTNGALSLSNEDNNQVFQIELLQDAVGGRTVTWFSGIKWANGGSVPILTTTASKKDVFIFRYTGAGAYDGYIVGQNI